MSSEYIDKLTKPSDEFQYYLGTIYFTNFEIFQERINTDISGHPSTDWQHHLLNRHGAFNRAFSVNCGNGWVERGLYQLGAIRSVAGIDLGSSMVQEAEREASTIGMPSEYMVADCNRFDSLGRQVDLIINHAAMHHVAYINRLTCQFASMLSHDGRYVCYDYIGPHRNQYPWEMWSAVLEFNATLPAQFRHPEIVYPHMKTMLHTDPTEAIHSELQIEVMKRYFDIEQYTPLGGPIAYHILFENKALFNARHTPDGISTLNRILDADTNFAKQHPHTNLLAFWIAKPKPQGSIPDAMIGQWQKEEDDREAAAAANGGRYYPISALEMICNELCDARYELSLLKSAHCNEPPRAVEPRKTGRWAKAAMGALRRFVAVRRS